MLLLECLLYPDSLSQLCIDIIMKSLCCAWSLWRNLHMAGMADRKDKTSIEVDILCGPSLGSLFQHYIVANLYNPRNSTIAGLELV